MRPNRSLLELLDHHGMLSASEAAEMLGKSRSLCTRQCHDLVARGWAVAEQDADDKRVILFRLTKAGKDALDGKGDRAAHRLQRHA